jgi:hypothetical protein
VLYVGDIQLREGREAELDVDGTVAFLTPAEQAAGFVRWSHVVARSDTVLCDPGHRPVGRPHRNWTTSRPTWTP